MQWNGFHDGFPVSLYITSLPFKISKKVRTQDCKKYILAWGLNFQAFSVRFNYCLKMSDFHPFLAWFHLWKIPKLQNAAWIVSWVEFRVFEFLNNRGQNLNKTTFETCTNPLTPTSVNASNIKYHINSEFPHVFYFVNSMKLSNIFSCDQAAIWLVQSVRINGLKSSLKKCLKKHRWITTKLGPRLHQNLTEE